MRTLAFKLTLAFLVVGLTGAVLVAVITRQRTRAAFDQFILNREQQALVDYLVRYYQENGDWDGVAENLRFILNAPARNTAGPRDLRRDWARFVLVGPDRTILFSSPGGQRGQAVSPQEIERAVPLEAGGETIGWLMLVSPRRQWVPDSPEAVFLRNVNRAALLGALVAVILALTLGGLLAYRLTRSLRELTEASDEIARGRFGRQVAVRTKDELGDLAASFNKMSQDLAQAAQARQQMTADIAHDLRSPLTVIAGYAEALSEGKLPGTPEVYDAVYQETRQLSRLVEDLRTLSLADAGELSLALQPTGPRSLLELVASRHALAARQKGVSIRVEAGKDLPPVNVDPERIAQVFDNLIRNALRYTPAGGEIILAAGTENETVRLHVRDSGSGISAEDLPHVFDRFYRGDQSRHESGESGLGLAIAKSIVAAHGGEICAQSAPGQGTTITIKLAIIRTSNSH